MTWAYAAQTDVYITNVLLLLLVRPFYTPISPLYRRLFQVFQHLLQMSEIFTSGSSFVFMCIFMMSNDKSLGDRVSKCQLSVCVNVRAGGVSRSSRTDGSPRPQGRALQCRTLQHGTLSTPCLSLSFHCTDTISTHSIEFSHRNTNRIQINAYLTSHCF